MIKSLNLNRNSLSEYLHKKVGEYDYAPTVYKYGTVISSRDSVVSVSGLTGCRYGELLQFDNDTYGIAMDLSEESIGAVLLNSNAFVTAGSTVRGTGQIADIPVGESVIGRVLDPLGRPLDNGVAITGETRPLENPAPSIIDRAPVKRPLETGILAIDSMIPIGRGQRELIIGDRQTGKTSIAMATIRNQKANDVICVYVSIGQRASSTARLVHELRECGHLEHTIFVSASASDSPAMQYLAPFAGCAIAEYFMYSGRDVLIIYDDLSKHAIAYRTISLLLRRPSGREAYPGDIFYLHSRLLERGAQLNEVLGGGSMTALPIIETIGNDISAYIPNNVISITDGQIFLSSALFFSGMRPAINVGLSVSRIGSSAQHSAIKWIGGRLRLSIAQYRELAAFSQFGAELDEHTTDQIRRGERMLEVLKQGQYDNLSVSQEAILLLAISTNFFSNFTLNKITQIKGELLEYIHYTCPGSMHAIETTGDLNPDEIATLKQAMLAFLEDYNAKHE